MNKALCLAALFVIALSPSHAQVGLKGKVIDASTNSPIQGATVSTSDTRSHTVTDSKGNFTLDINYADSITLTSTGYNTKSVAVSGTELFLTLYPSFTHLNEVIVTAGRELQRRTEVPVAIHVISKASINETKATRLDMLINKVPGVFMVDLGNEQHSMSVRQPLGYKNLFLYLEDGIPIRTVGDFNHNALIEINHASLERIEVIKGPASSLYGSEAVGGAVNFITQSPSRFLSGKIQAETGSRGYKRADFNISNTYKKTGFFLGGYFADQNQAEQEHNDFRKAALTFRGDLSFNNKLKLTTVADYISYRTDQKGGLDSAHFYAKDYSSFYRFTYRKINALRLRSTLNVHWNESNKTSLTFFYRNSKIGQNPFYYISNIPNSTQKAKGQVNEDAFKSYGSVLQHTSKFNRINAKLISGLSIDYSPATYFAEFIDVDKDVKGVYYNYTVSDSMLTDYKVHLYNSAVYTQFEYSPVHKLKVVAAARYDRLDYKFDNHLPPGAFTGAPDAADHFSHFTPKFGATYDLGKSKGVYLNYSIGFAPPNITDLYTGVEVPVLKASSYRNYEVGGWVSFAANKGYAEFSLYRLDGENEIISVRLADGTYQNQNAGKTKHKGIEANIRYAPVEEVNLRIGGTLAEHRYVDYVERGKSFSGYKMAQSPPLIFNGELTYKPQFFKCFRISIEVQGMNKYFTDPQNTSTYKGFTVLNARAAYRINSVELWLNCLNATNKLFATTVEKTAYGTSYRPGQLRTINVGFGYNFRKHKS